MINRPSALWDLSSKPVGLHPTPEMPGSWRPHFGHSLSCEQFLKAAIAVQTELAAVPESIDHDLERWGILPMAGVIEMQA